MPADLEDALAAAPAARERFWSLPPEHVDAWVRYVERGRFPGARRRRIGQAVRRLSGRPRGRTATTVTTNGNTPVVAPPRDEWLAWLLGLLVLAGVIALVLWLAVFRHHSSKPTATVVSARATVPHVVGIRVQAAKFQLKEAKLSTAVVLQPSRKRRGLVIGQAPRTGKHVPQGTTVRLVVSNGPPGVKVPGVVGLAAADAVQRLQAAKLGATLTQTPSTQAPGTVLAQRPAAGKRAKPGTKVALEVAKGKASVTVPNLVGRTQQDASAALRRAGLTARVVRVPSSQPAGTVVAESPPAGRKVAQGSVVRLNVGKGHAPPPTTTVRTTTTTAAPSPPTKSATPYSGMKLPAAVQKIAQGRQQALVVYVTSSRPVGTVVSSSTAGSRVRLNVSAGPQPAPATSVPDVTGEDKATALSDLQGAGFKVVQVQWPVTDQASDGVVVAETPVGRAPQGAAIVVYIGSATG